jgi:ABC-type multidrug transport system fused ATPase/permease subunit
MAASVLPPLLGDLARARAAATRLFEILDRAPARARGGLTLPALEGRVELRDVTVFYPSQARGPGVGVFSLHR